MEIEKQVIDNRIFLCKDFLDKCDIKYPHFPCWQLCGESYIWIDQTITCRRYEMIKKILGEKRVICN
ncbi:MAG: hypothetical protein Q7S06_02640 [Nanoarchaeota archaeon]|nr:hypothetical protein [Nanoarchaeota archaeon]